MFLLCVYKNNEGINYKVIIGFMCIFLLNMYANSHVLDHKFNRGFVCIFILYKLFKTYRNEP